MILKKPYAFLIKHFKLIHIIMTILFGYLIYKTNVILSFLNRYMDSKELVTGKNLVVPLFSVIIYIVLAIIILLCVAIFILMRYKKKPYGFYFLNILSCIGLIVIYVFVQTTIGTMEEKVMSLQTVRLARDLLTIAILLQTSSLVVNFIRSIGFNIKKFNFEDDYAELNIESKDNEEFELELSVDTNKLRRNWRKRIRHFKYVYAEHKYIINLLGLLVILVLVFAISFVLGLFDKRYRENDLFTTNQYIMGIMDSYVVTENYKGNTINDSQFVILRLNIKNRFNSDNTFTVARSSLVVDGDKFYHTRSYKEEFKDLGNVYLDQSLTQDATNYLLVYEIPSGYSTDKATFQFQDSDLKTNYDVKIEPENLEENENVKDYNLKETIEINNLMEISLKIDSYQIARSFKLNYNFCITTNECYDSVEYLYPSLSGRNDKALLKLEGSINLEKNYITDIKNLSNFISYFGVIEYEKDGSLKTQKTGLKRVLPNNSKTKDYYIEINEDVMSADKIYLSFVIRNNTYRYQLK